MTTERIIRLQFTIRTSSSLLLIVPLSVICNYSYRVISVTTLLLHIIMIETLVLNCLIFVSMIMPLLVMLKGASFY